jgi:hypothetical protein
MLYSSDPELVNLGMSTLTASIEGYWEFKTLRGLSIQGKAFFSYGCRGRMKLLGRELRKKANHSIVKAEKRSNTLRLRKYLRNDGQGKGDA